MPTIDLGLVKGPQGEKGDPGPQGIQGVQGIQGPKGDTGEKGDPGEVTLAQLADYLKRNGDNAMTGDLKLQPEGATGYSKVKKNASADGDYGLQLQDNGGDGSFMGLTLCAKNQKLELKMKGADEETYSYPSIYHSMNPQTEIAGDYPQFELVAGENHKAMIGKSADAENDYGTVIRDTNGENVVELKLRADNKQLRLAHGGREYAIYHEGNAPDLDDLGGEPKLTATTTGSLVTIDPSYDGVAEVSGLVKNLLAYPYYRTTMTVNGVTLTDNGDGTITANGTSTANAIFELNTVLALKNGATYSLSGCPSGGGSGKWKLDVCDSNTDASALDYGEGDTFIANGTETMARLVVYSNNTFNNLTFRPMLVKGSEPKPFVPYGGYEVKSCGKNLFDKSKAIVGFINSDYEFLADDTYRTVYCPVKENTNYIFRCSAETVEHIRVTYQRADGSIIRRDTQADTVFSFVTPADAVKIAIGMAVATTSGVIHYDLNTGMLEEGSTQSDYEPYTGDSFRVVQSTDKAYVKTYDGVTNIFTDYGVELDVNYGLTENGAKVHEGGLVRAYSNIKTFIGLGQIGLTRGSETIATVANALPVNSILKYGVGGSNANIYPEIYGTTTVEKLEGNRVRFDFFDIDSNGNLMGNAWIRVVHGNADSGWVQYVNRDGHLPLTGGTINGNGIYFKSNQYTTNTMTKVDDIGHSRFVVIDDIEGGTYRALRLWPLSAKTLAESVDYFDDATSASFKIFGEHNKPSGSYTGNATARTVDIGGIGKALYVYKSSDGTGYLVTPSGCIKQKGTTLTGISGTVYANGTLTLPANSELNASGATYTYQAL